MAALSRSAITTASPPVVALTAAVQVPRASNRSDYGITILVA
jgi:hypothetical protein